MSALANLFARKQIAGTLTGVIPDVIKPELASAVATIKAEEAPQTKVATGDPGVAVKVAADSDVPHVDAPASTNTTASTADSTATTTQEAK